MPDFRVDGKNGLIVLKNFHHLRVQASDPLGIGGRANRTYLTDPIFTVWSFSTKYALRVDRHKRLRHRWVPSLHFHSSIFPIAQLTLNPCRIVESRITSPTSDQSWLSFTNSMWLIA